MNPEIAISVSHVSKTFRIPHEKVSSLRGAAISAFKRNKGFEEFKALDACPVNFFDSFGVKNLIGDVSFEVKKGEFFARLDSQDDLLVDARRGIIGRNGSGKSTLLKILAGKSCFCNQN
jgi:ABC-2 type transport system ATP-binding protein